MTKNTRKILIVDDNALLMSVLTEIFSECGWNVGTASDGFEALKCIRASAPDVLLSDLNMLGMSGFELLSVVRRRYPSIAVIAMSGAYSGVSVPPGVAADAFYGKGTCSTAQLLEIVREIEHGRGTPMTRPEAPTWIPPIRFSPVHNDAVLVACPECLRAFAHTPDETGLQKINCLHCLCPIQLALVQEPSGIDLTSFSDYSTSRSIVEHNVANRGSFGAAPVGAQV